MSLPESLPDIPNQWLDWNLTELKEFCESRQPLPDMNDFEVSELAKGVRFKLRESVIKNIVAVPNFPLKIIDASTTSVAKVRVVLGYVAGFKADAGMTAGTDSPVFLLTLPSAAATYYVLAKVTVGYTAATGLWTASACTIVSPAPTSITANTSTLIYVNLGTATVVSNGSGGYRCSSVTPAVEGSLAVARVGNSTTYADYAWH